MLDKSKVKLGIAPIAWTNDDMPDLGAENTFEQCISEMALAGFTGCEVGNKYPRDTKVLKKALELRGMQICNAWFSSFLITKPYEEVEKDFIEHITFLKEMGAKVVGISEQGHSIQGTDLSIFDDKYVMNDEEWEMAKMLVEQFDNAPTEQHYIAVLRCLRDSFIWIPGNMKISNDDENFLKNAKVGDTFTPQQDMRFVPDILQNGDEFFLPVFSNAEQMGEYGNHFSKIEKHFFDAMRLALGRENVCGIKEGHVHLSVNTHKRIVRSGKIIKRMKAEITRLPKICFFIIHPTLLIFSYFFESKYNNQLLQARK